MRPESVEKKIYNDVILKKKINHSKRFRKRTRMVRRSMKKAPMRCMEALKCGTPPQWGKPLNHAGRPLIRLDVRSLDHLCPIGQIGFHARAQLLRPLVIRRGALLLRLLLERGALHHRAHVGHQFVHHRGGVAAGANNANHDVASTFG